MWLSRYISFSSPHCLQAAMSNALFTMLACHYLSAHAVSPRRLLQVMSRFLMILAPLYFAEGTFPARSHSYHRRAKRRITPKRAREISFVVYRRLLMLLVIFGIYADFGLLRARASTPRGASASAAAAMPLAAGTFSWHVRKRQEGEGRGRL